MKTKYGLNNPVIRALKDSVEDEKDGIHTCSRKKLEKELLALRDPQTPNEIEAERILRKELQRRLSYGILHGYQKGIKKVWVK